MLAIAFSRARTPSEVASVLMIQGCAAFDVPRGLIGVLSDDETTLEIVQMGGFSVETQAAWRSVPMTLSAPLTDAVRSGESSFYGTAEEVTSQFPHLADARGPGDSALAALPLATADGRTFGAIGLVFDRPCAFSADDRQQMIALAALCGQAMDRARLYETAQTERRRAEDANSAKDVFLTTVSHDLRTPLAAILGWTQLLQSEPPDASRLQSALATIERNALAQAKLIDDLLDVGAIISGNVHLNRIAVDVVKLIENAVDTVRPAADSKGVRLLSVLGQTTRTVEVDSERLQRVLWNLLSNAIKFTPLGGDVRIRLETADSHVEIQVEDSGAGIDADFLPHVFETFRQEDKSKTPRHDGGGVGLGLAIAKHLVDLHGGSIRAASGGRGLGATFTVRLPIAPSPNYNAMAATRSQDQ